MKKTLSFLFCLLISQLFGAPNTETAYAQLVSYATQTPTAGTGSMVRMESNSLLHNFDLSPTKDSIIAKIAGVYLVFVSGQAGALASGASGYIDCWFEKNGKPVPTSNSRQSVDTSISANLLTLQFIIDLAPGDTLATKFSSSGPSLGFVYIKPDAEPAINSFILSITKIN